MGVGVRVQKGDATGYAYTEGANTPGASQIAVLLPIPSGNHPFAIGVGGEIADEEELGETQHNVITSNRRFRDDEFLIGRDLTRWRERIRVRVKFTPVNVELFPGHPFPVEPAWSEMRYTCYSYTLPEFIP